MKSEVQKAWSRINRQLAKVKATLRQHEKTARAAALVEQELSRRSRSR